MHWVARTASLALLALPVAAQAGIASPKSPARPPAIRVLIDSVHADNYLRAPVGRDVLNYHVEYGFRRAFRYLKSRGVILDELTSGRLTAANLSGHRMLFINLVSSDLPPFLVSEIAAVKRFIEMGGSLFVIQDHSNCYYSAYKLMPLMEELGIHVTTETACDVAPNVVGDGNGWIAVSRFKAHPVTRGLKTVCLQTGGTVDDRYSVVFTSDQAWGDQWHVGPYGEAPNLGHYGNWKKDPGERSGPLGVVLAKRLGRGRIVVVADQNVFGDPFLNYSDNYRLWLNVVGWLASEPSLADSAAYRRWRGPRIVAYEQYSKAAWGNTGLRGNFNLLVALQRRLWLFFSNDLSQGQDLIVFAHDKYSLPEAARDAAVAHLKAGRNIVVMGEWPYGSGKEPTVLDQLSAVLGKPRVEQVNGNRSCTWPGCGQVVLLPRAQPFWNAIQPAQDRAPNEAQRVFLDAFVQFLKGLAAHPAHR